MFVRCGSYITFISWYCLSFWCSLSCCYCLSRCYCLSCWWSLSCCCWLSFWVFYLVTQFMQSWSDNKLPAIRPCMYMLLPRKKATSHIQILHTDLFSIPAANDVGNRCRFIKFVFFLNFRKNDFIAQVAGNMVELFCSKVTHVIASYWHFLPVLGLFHKLHVLL